MSVKALFTNSGLRWIWLAVVMLIVDQASKQLVVATMDYRETINVMPFFNLTYVHNPGAAFSFLADQGGWQRWFFSAIAFVVSIVLVVWMAKTPKQDKFISIAFALILSGAVGNLIDRFMFGYVIDFLDFYVGNKHWPAFNIADSAIFIGAAMMLLESFKAEKDNNGENAKQTLEQENKPSE